MVQKVHLVEIDGVTSSMRLADVYDATGSNIGTVLNISVPTDQANLPDNTRPLEMSSALRNGLLVRLNIRYTTAADGGKAKYARIICPIDRAYVAITQLEGKSYRGGTVVNVSVPQRARYS